MILVTPNVNSQAASVEEDVIQRYTQKVIKIDSFDTYKNYVNKQNGSKFDKLDKFAKIVFILREIEITQEQLDWQFKRFMTEAVAYNKLSGTELPDIDLLASAIDILKLSKTLADKHIRFIDDNIYSLSDSQQKQLRVYKSKVINMYKKKGLISEVKNDLPIQP